MKVIRAESGALGEFLECGFFFGILDETARIGDLRRALLLEGRLIGPAALARPKARGLRLGSCVMESHIHAMG
jgi:hypothetical protein